ncbi:plasmid mobilization relaxosome protein MobC [Bifidobacterium pseudolongum]|uniref:plasmid mobilization relaxosome protein MobC n=1 Tax=Bifidobacterium pseudolongum TaxID=1694 RepID=UPI00101FAFED|nr:plasmid mobilization relaxosome protein MobC [Bifidobacterium pseudolongum]RYQ65493.1 hypothetical protein PG2103B_1717 [Bifidobacterium pseudolongum subsp. globosum]
MSEKDNRRNSRQIHLRVTPEVWQEIQELYKRTQMTEDPERALTFNEWATQMLRWGHVEQIVVAIDPISIRKTLGEIGNNINQIAHVANATQSFSEPQARQLQEQFGRLWDFFLLLNDDYNDIKATRK